MEEELDVDFFVELELLLEEALLELEEEELDSVSVSVSVRMTVAGPLLLLV